MCIIKVLRRASKELYVVSIVAYQDYQDQWMDMDQSRGGPTGAVQLSN